MGKSKDLATGASYQDQTESDARYVNVSGDTMTGALHLNTTLGSKQLELTGVEADIWLNSTGPNKTWRILGSTGSNTHKLRFYDQSNTAERMAIDASGRVTMPYQPVFEADGGTAHGVYNAGVRIFTDARINQGGHYSTTTGRFTAPIAGKYFFYTNFDYLEGSTGTAAFFIRKNGSNHNFHDHHDWGSGSGSWMSHSLQGIISLAANDYVDVYSGTAHIAMDNWSNFGGYLIG